MPFCARALPGRTISMRLISMPARVPQGSCRDHRIMLQGPMGKLPRPNESQAATGSSQGRPRGPYSESSYRQASAKPWLGKWRL
jgi:hypothetical protein